MTTNRLTKSTLMTPIELLTWGASAHAQDAQPSADAVPDFSLIGYASGSGTAELVFNLPSSNTATAKLFDLSSGAIQRLRPVQCRDS